MILDLRTGSRGKSINKVSLTIINNDLISCYLFKFACEPLVLFGELIYDTIIFGLVLFANLQVNAQLFTNALKICLQFCNPVFVFDFDWTQLLTENIFLLFQQLIVKDGIIINHQAISQLLVSHYLEVCQK